MVAFALGGILGDTILHLVPEVFFGEASEHEVSLVVVTPQRNLVLGVAIIVGFLTFVAMDKTLRIATGGSGHSHDHAYATPPEGLHASEDAKTSAVAVNETNLKNRKSKKPKQSKAERHDEPQVAPVKLSAYLNLIADFTVSEISNSIPSATGLGIVCLS